MSSGKYDGLEDSFMRVKTKILVTFSVVGILVTALGIWTIKTMYSSSSGLSYIVGPAWDTADGAMETTIQIEAQMLAVNRLILGEDSQRVEQILNTAITDVDTSSSRMIEAGLLSAAQTQQFSQFNSQYQQSRNALITSYKNYIETKKSYDKATQVLVDFGEKLETLGDSAVEELEREPNRNITWQSDVMERWQAADGGMESNIGLLWKLYYTQRLLDGQDDATQIKAIEQAIGFQKQANSEMFSTGRFTISAGEEWKNASYEEVFSQLNSQHEQAMMAVIESYRNYRQIYQEYTVTSLALLDFIAELEELADSKVEQQAVLILDGQAWAISSFKVLIIIALLVLLLLGWILVNQILSPIQRLQERVTDISEGNGDLTLRVNITTQDEFGELGKSFDKFIEKIQNLIADITQSTNLAKTAAVDLSATFKVTAEAVNKQTFEVNTISNATTAMTAISSQVISGAREISQSVLNIDKNAQSTLSNVRQAAQSVNELVAEVTQGTETINSLKNHVTSIEPVLADINGIAEQTNLLALNAAIEAARAGEQGRGFAVVADEVRSLATRTQGSTNTIQQSITQLRSSADESVRVINNSMLKGTQTTEITSQAEESLHQVAIEISRLTQMNQQTSEAITHQEQSVTSIASSLSHLQALCQSAQEKIQQSEHTISALKLKQEDLALKMSKFKI
ncbi:TPA: methyl-accepting chemotaxis protein [Vibrio cholerae O1]|uniref:Methyl-accepting chemotaxis protein n=4 Tax=Vibrio cholerae TaxID=666 RepID=A0A0K9UZI4_VIBCL|nr:methyl-accepting chemotaxis protein [Vibrio cholerae O395]ACP06194.1 methyl-accepting chemotaxis protein [Vibrio cholerae M66-2]AUR70190.1 methyl-accepting chemotaxis protein [Vibrio cholerae]EAZ72729.1 methyl-accepting chemotaxis protein [Vibrio cholerae NCTC 8457]EFH78383.1 methyl-accepting chemotaxis protein [Vibrio cholerae MAK 757]KNA61689.1 methyl-accepting chemotaxis protein [Vibrio cholerae 2740-80]PVX22813.1 methyl-accepting chemotaxis protein [Vibrio cholerae O1 biovar El Tor]QH